MVVGELAIQTFEVVVVVILFYCCCLMFSSPQVHIPYREEVYARRTRVLASREATSPIQNLEDIVNQRISSIFVFLPFSIFPVHFRCFLSFAYARSCVTASLFLVCLQEWLSILGFRVSYQSSKLCKLSTISMCLLCHKCIC